MTEETLAFKEGRKKTITKKRSLNNSGKQRNLKKNISTHKEIKKATELNKIRTTSQLRDTKDKLSVDIEDKLKEWTNYVKDLFKDKDRRGQIEKEYLEEIGPEIIRQKKSKRPDEIPAEHLYLTYENAIYTLLNHFNYMYCNE